MTQHDVDDGAFDDPGAGEYSVTPATQQSDAEKRDEPDDLWQASVNTVVGELSEAVAFMPPKYEAYDTSPNAVANRTYIAATKELIGIVSYWFNSNTTYYQSVLPIDKDEMIRRLDQLVRTLRHTR